MHLIRSLVLLLPVVVLPAQEHKELGRMWTFESVPLAWLQQAYDFAPTPQWLDYARMASLRFGRGCSASFVSPGGLIMTNHHCARDQISQVQGKNDWLKDGFYAGSYDGEVKIPGLTVQQLVAMRDVTKEVQDGRKTEELLAEAKEQRKDLDHQLVTLYQGGMYQIYSYRVFDDVRLVCAPHGQSAHFGGDPDNFCYPRWGLDFTFVRAWDGDKPADTSSNYFAWKERGPSEGEAVFVTGNPGSTGRLQTLAQCEYRRDHFYPTRLEGVRQQIAAAQAEAKKSPEAEKQLRAEILRHENTRKALQGYLDGLRNPRILAIKQKAESDLRAAVGAVPALQEKYGDAWDVIARLQQEKVEWNGRMAALRQRPKPASEEEKAAQAAEVTALEAEGKALTDKERQQQIRIGEACFAVYGTSIPPDATFTLRLSDGVVKGYAMNGTIAPWATSLYGLYARHAEFDGHHPFDLPQVWIDKRDQFDLATKFNFVATCDIIGGNSGSPMIDKQLNAVGLIFDGNIEMLGNRYVFDDEVSRTVCVHPAIISASLRTIYGAASLADELEQGAKSRVIAAKAERAFAPADTVGR
jgi:hypothetical protein